MGRIARFIIKIKRIIHPGWGLKECPDCWYYAELWGFAGGLWMCDKCGWNKSEDEVKGEEWFRALASASISSFRKYEDL